MNRRLFREEAINRRGQREPLDGLLRVSAPHEWVILAILGAGFLGLVLWSVFGAIERVSSADCVLVRPGPRYVMTSATTGIVVETLAGVGEIVDVGQPLARMHSPDLTRRLELARTLVAALEGDSNPSNLDATGAALSLARAELARLEAARESGRFLLSDARGELTSLSLVPGESVVAGEPVAFVRTGDQHDIEAVSFVDREVASRISPGMPARVRIPTVNSGGAGSVSAQILGVSPRPVPAPEWLQSFGIDAPDGSHEVRLAMPGAPPTGAHDGQPCELHVVTDRLRPIAALGR